MNRLSIRAGFIRLLREPAAWIVPLIGVWAMIILALPESTPPEPSRTPLGFYVGESTVVIERTPIAFLGGEYERTLVVYRQGLEINRREMFLDTGGTVRLNVYRDGHEHLILIDRIDAYVARLDNGSVTVVSGETGTRASGGMYGKPPTGFPKPGWAFLGAFDNTGQGRSREFRFIPVSERPEMPVESSL